MALQMLINLQSFLQTFTWCTWLGILFLILSVVDYIINKPPKNFPPRPICVPFLGNIFHLSTKQAHIDMNKLSKTYGEIYSLRLSSTRVVVLCGLNILKEALVNQADIFSDRAKLPLLFELFKGQGLLHSSGTLWKQQRRFALTTLKNFGLGKKSLEERILEEIKHLHVVAEKEKGQPFDPQNMIQTAVANIIASIVFGDRFNYSDIEFQELVCLFAENLTLQSSIWTQPYLPPNPFSCSLTDQSMLGQPFDPQNMIQTAVANIIASIVFGDRFNYSDIEFQELVCLFEENLTLQSSIWTQMYNAFPNTMKLLPGPHKKIFRNWEKILQFVKERVQAHKKEWESSCSRDFIDSYLCEIEKFKGSAVSTFHEDNLCSCAADLFLAGTETTSTTLHWGLLYMAVYPEIQEKVQAEIDKVVGHGREPRMEDKLNMPYTDAVLHELQRISNVLPISVPRCTNKDTMLGGYFLPKGTIVIPTLTSVLYATNEWETPYVFNPEHFLDENGKLKKRDSFVPFSIGKRNCIGEQLTKMELFLFFTSLLQKFTFQAPKGTKLSLKVKVGITLSPLPYKIHAIPRLQSYI
ncbi:cytochrome P450 2J2 [Protopterus annectens]|uniref:cytochrome P450 2J2 n=1 Tax=Protopterus annectens TaxID=7888 RepID=UPI001CFB162E|nr:cytochrome P450 2J2 [Protopterus annectens]